MHETTGKHWGIALHGGAGVISRSMPGARREACIAALGRILDQGRARLSAGDAALDVVEAVACLLEDEPLFNAGRGAVFTSEGTHELEASIMDGATLGCGAVAGLQTVRNPIHLARMVMERTGHILLCGDGAEAFADEIGVERVDPSWFDTDRRRSEFERFLSHDVVEQEGSTIGVVACDTQGQLAAATSTGGMTGKLPGRVGDTPLLGAGNYANGTCAVSCTGRGEEFIRHGVARAIAARVDYAQVALDEAVNTTIRELDPGTGGVIAIGRDGIPVAVFNSLGMYRGLADATGRFETAIWED